MNTATVLQVLGAITVLIILFVIGFSIYNRDMVKNMKEARQTKRVTPIFTGVLDFKGMHPQFDTMDPDHPTYKNLNPSMNQRAGAEFTYNFWLYQASNNRTKDERVPPLVDGGVFNQEVILLLKGDPRTVNYKNICGTEKTDVFVKCPLIKLSQGGDVLAIELNTVQGPDGLRENARNVCNDLITDWNIANGHKIALRNMKTSNLMDKWYMVTVVIQDTSPDDPMPLRNKVRVRVYINGMLELDRFVDGKLSTMAPSVIRQNTGDLYVHPVAKTGSTDASNDVGTSRSVMMADLTYFNYALSQTDIQAQLKKQFTKRFVAGCSSNVTAADKKLLNRISQIGTDVDNQLVAF